MKLYKLKEKPEYPSWTTCKKVHYSHQARLIQKDPVFYKKKFSPPEQYHTLSYIWPARWTHEELFTLSAGELSEPYKDEPQCDSIKKMVLNV